MQLIKEGNTFFFNIGNEAFVIDSLVSAMGFGSKVDNNAVIIEDEADLDLVNKTEY